MGASLVWLINSIRRNRSQVYKTQLKNGGLGILKAAVFYPLSECLTFTVLRISRLFS